MYIKQVNKSHSLSLDRNTPYLEIMLFTKLIRKLNVIPNKMPNEIWKGLATSTQPLKIKQITYLPAITKKLGRCGN